MNICLFSQEEISKPLFLKDERAEHIIKILHKKEGDTFAAGIIGGKSGIAKITGISDAIYFDFEPCGDGKFLNPLKMIIGFPRPIQLKRLLRDVAALGICEVHLTGTELGEKSYMKSNLVENGAAYKMLLDGTVQAGSTHVPSLFIHETLNVCLNAVCTQEDKAKKSVLFALDNVNPASSLKDGLEKAFADKENCKNTECIAAIGSERGWTDKERLLLEEKGFIRCGMGERIMRTETASTVAASVILNKMGYLE